MREELARVALRTDQRTRDGRDVPAGAAGTIVDVLAGGRAYIVEFVRPFAAIVTVEAHDLETAGEG